MQALDIHTGGLATQGRHQTVSSKPWSRDRLFFSDSHLCTEDFSMSAYIQPYHLPTYYRYDWRLPAAAPHTHSITPHAPVRTPRGNVRAAEETTMSVAVKPPAPAQNSPICIWSETSGPPPPRLCPAPSVNRLSPPSRAGTTTAPLDPRHSRWSRPAPAGGHSAPLLPCTTMPAVLEYAERLARLNQRVGDRRCW